jgi:large subunit ribosomal protein L6
MSKIGQKIISIPASVTVTIDGKKIDIKGPVGDITFTVPQSLNISKQENNLLITRINDEKKVASLHGLYRQLINNAVIGVEKPWQKRLEVVGTGYSVRLQGEDLIFKIGYSHQVTFKKQLGVKYQVEGNKVIVLSCDKQLAGQVAYQIKILRKPDVYKGKGIRYEGEKLRIKPGKKVKVAGAAA